MMMPNRSYAAASGYRYGFNGKENDNEVKGEGNEQDYGMRVYDPRLGRFLSFDPYFKEYNYLSPYHFAGDNPIRNLDKDGGEPKDYMDNWQPRRIINQKTGATEYNPMTLRGPYLSVTDYEAVYDKTTDHVWFITHGNDGQYYYWKHNPGADQTRYITGAGKDNGMWAPFETKNKVETDKINSDHTNEYIFVGMIVVPVAALTYGGLVGDVLLAKRLTDKVEEQTQTNEKPVVETDPVTPQYNYGKYGSNFKDHAEEIREDVGIPKDWEVKPSDKDEGVRFIDPANPKANNVRVMPGRPGSQTEEPYVVQYKNGTPVNANGDPVQSTTGAEQNKANEIHVPLKDYKF